MKPLHQLNVINNLIYALADVIETNLMDLEAWETAPLRIQAQLQHCPSWAAMPKVRIETKPSAGTDRLR